MYLIFSKLSIVNTIYMYMFETKIFEFLKNSAHNLSDLSKQIFPDIYKIKKKNNSSNGKKVNHKIIK